MNEREELRVFATMSRLRNASILTRTGPAPFAARFASLRKSIVVTETPAADSAAVEIRSIAAAATSILCVMGRISFQRARELCPRFGGPIIVSEPLRRAIIIFTKSSDRGENPPTEPTIQKEESA